MGGKHIQICSFVLGLYFDSITVCYYVLHLPLLLTVFSVSSNFGQEYLIWRAKKWSFFFSYFVDKSLIFITCQCPCMMCMVQHKSLCMFLMTKYEKSKTKLANRYWRNILHTCTMLHTHITCIHTYFIHITHEHITYMWIFRSQCNIST